jgi:hypothetical protein
VVGEEWPTGVWGRQAPRAFSLEEAPACGRGSSLVAVFHHEWHEWTNDTSFVKANRKPLVAFRYLRHS